MRCGPSEHVTAGAGRLQPSASRSPAGFALHATLAAVLALMLAACGRASDAPPVIATAQTQPPATGAAVPHGDHNPHHGGIVMMKGNDLHYEVVLDASGHAHQIFFTDAVREELPASIATDVTVTLKRPGKTDDRVALAIDEAGESWIGHGDPVTDPDHTTARVAFTIHGEPYWIDLPFRQPSRSSP
jgi:hypothetical protein